MISQVLSPQIQTRDAVRPSFGAAGNDRPTGAAPPPASSDLGPTNPRLRIDRDLGMVVIEFRDSTGRVSVSLPTPRELEAYRAAILFGAEMPADVRAMNISPGSPSSARPSVAMPSEAETPPAAAPKAEATPAPSLNKIA